MQNENLSNKNVSLKWLFISVGIVAVIGIVAWWMQSSKYHRMTVKHNQYIKESASRSAETVANAIGTFGNKQIVAEDWKAMQESANELVRDKSLAYIAIINLKDVAIVHTNGSFKGSKLSEIKNTENSVSASVPVMNLTRKVATVQVGINVDQLEMVR